jgi:hypothetical protein
MGSLVSKVWLADSVRGRVRGWSGLESTRLIMGGGTGKAYTVPWVCCGHGDCSALSWHVDPPLGLQAVSCSGWLARPSDSDDRHEWRTETADDAADLAADSDD